jgi:hypothetical protein
MRHVLLLSERSAHTARFDILTPVSVKDIAFGYVTSCLNVDVNVQVSTGLQGIASQKIGILK